LTLWAAIAGSYLSNLPIGFFVGTLSALVYLVARAWDIGRTRRFQRQLA